MRQTIVITDLTQMPAGNQVCVVGINEKGQCIRPVCEGGFNKKYLYARDRLIVRPRAKIEFDLVETKIEPPHTEDKIFDPNTLKDYGFCNDNEWESVLRNNSFKIVDSIFEGFLMEGSWVKPGSGNRSIATLSKASKLTVQLPEWEGNLRYRLIFQDDSRYSFDCSISDLAFRELAYTEVKKKNRERLEVSKELTKSLNNVDRIYLRLGLARPFKRSDTDELRCYLQVTSIYTFPDYLQGKTFADF